MQKQGSCSAQVRLAAGLLGALAGRPHALRLLLASHSARLKRAQTLLLKPQNAGAPISFPVASSSSQRPHQLLDVPHQALTL